MLRFCVFYAHYPPAAESAHCTAALLMKTQANKVITLTICAIISTIYAPQVMITLLCVIKLVNVFLNMFYLYGALFPKCNPVCVSKR